MVSYDELQELAEILVQKIEEEFENKHLSRNLMNTIQIIAEPEKINVVIPAQTYNMLKFQQQGVVIHNGRGSYASKLDKTGSEFFIYPKGTRKGSFKIKPHNHIGYVDKVIEAAISEWIAKSQKYKLTNKTELGE